MMTKIHLRGLSVLLIPLICLFLVSSCKPKQEQEQELTATNTYSDTASLPSHPSAQTEQEESADIPVETHDIIDYIGVEDAVRLRAQSYQPFTALSVLATSFIRKKDRLRSAGRDALKESEKSIYAAILDYKRYAESGKLADEDAPPALLELPRHVGNTDSSFSQLPDAGGASFFRDNGNFFFIGGAPFVQKVVDYDSITFQEKSFTDSKGNPELRFQVPDSENVYYLFKSIMHFKKPRIKISFGGPVAVYDGPPDEVKGIGSIIHNFDDHIPVVFLTEDGLVPARLMYYQVPFTEQYRCYSDYPRFVFACNENIVASEILAMYIPYDDHRPKGCAVNRKSKWLWTADIDDDAIPDIACAIGTFEGIQSDALLEMLWFVNVNGEWKIIDYGNEPSCT